MSEVRPPRRLRRGVGVVVLALACLLSGLAVAPAADAHPGPHNHYAPEPGGGDGDQEPGTPTDRRMTPRQRWICYSACAAGFIGGTIAAGNPIFGGVVAISCATACSAVDIISGNVPGQRAFRYRVVVNPRSTETWQETVARFEQAVRSEAIEPDQVNNIKAFLNRVGTEAHRLVPSDCWVSERFRLARGQCAAWDDVQRAATAIRSIAVAETSSNGLWIPPRGHFRCESRRYYSNGETAYRMLGDNGRQLCPGVNLKLHVYRDGRVIEVIPAPGGGGGGGVGTPEYEDGMYRCDTGRHYFIKGMDYWQTTSPERLRFCPELRDAGMTFRGWAWPTNGGLQATETVMAGGVDGGIDVAWQNMAGSSGVGLYLDGRYWGWIPNHRGRSTHVPAPPGEHVIEVKAANPDGSHNHISLDAVPVVVPDQSSSPPPGDRAMSAVGRAGAIDISWTNLSGSSGVGIYVDGRYWGWVPTHEGTTKRINYGAGTHIVEVKAANPDGSHNHISLGTASVTVT